MPEGEELAYAETNGLKAPDVSPEDVIEKVQEVNKVLKKGEPNNITEDKYSGYTGYKPQYMIDAMNKVFGIGGWGFEELENKFFDKDENGKPTLAVCKVAIWIEGVSSLPVAYGQSRVTRGDYGDAKKGAQTDAIKKALSYFSVGSRAYRGQLSNSKA